MPRHPSTENSADPTAIHPEKRAAGAGESSFVRGSGARYMRLAGRWKSGSSALSIRKSQRMSSIDPVAPSAPMRAEPTRSQSAPPLSGAGTVTLAARGPSGRNSVNHSEPFGAAPGRLWTVYRIQAPSRSDGWQSFR